MTASSRFWSKVRIFNSWTCWIWEAARYGTGYGCFYVGAGRTTGAHRWSYEDAKGPIPDGLTIDHLCRNPLCVNPLHLEAVTRRENTLRGTAPAAFFAKQDKCIHGHPWDEQNTRYSKEGARQCRACGRDNWRSYRDRMRQLEPPHGTNNGYLAYGCRCDECRAAATAYKRAHYVPKAARAEVAEDVSARIRSAS